MKVKYLYVEEFDLKAQQYEPMFHGMQKGRVYRGVDTGRYTVLIADELNRNAVAVEQVQDSEVYSLKLGEIGRENIIKFNILEEDLDKIIIWMENNNEDLNPQPAPMLQLQRAMEQQEEDDAHFLKYLSGNLEELMNFNAIQVTVVNDVVLLLLEESTRALESAANRIQLSEHGLGANIAEALQAIEDYTSKSGPNEARSALLDQAIIALIRERERRILNDLD